MSFTTNKKVGVVQTSHNMVMTESLAIAVSASEDFGMQKISDIYKIDTSHLRSICMPRRRLQGPKAARFDCMFV